MITNLNGISTVWFLQFFFVEVYALKIGKELFVSILNIVRSVYEVFDRLSSLEIDFFVSNDPYGSLFSN